MADAVSDNNAKYFRKFLYKSALITIFLLLLSLAPEFINQTTTRSWELLHLIFVGIAVSYGLFSNRNNHHTDKDLDINNAQSYVSKMLQVSSVFDDESDIDDKVMIQTWNSQYSRGEPVVVVAAEEGNGEVQRQKPLLLPVRSLKQQPNEGGNSGFRRKNVDVFVGGVNEDDVVLRSPIPWRSRSGRMEEGNNKVELMRSFTKVDGGGGDDVVKKKGFVSAPPAPPPPPQLIRKSKSKMTNNAAAEKTLLTPSVPPPPPPPMGMEEELSEEAVRRSNSSVGRPGGVVINELVPDSSSSSSEEEEEEEEEDDKELGPEDVDKKADEFIAKFREQIRLQRIDSIRRSTAQRTGRSFR